ncbi:MAG: hypothetical protein JOY61_18850 [Chloroflexi bacterium]|nr:hypothetical protein [Chloroflexota bacterium]
MNNSPHVDPAERSAVMRLFYRDWRPTRLGPPWKCVAAHPAVHARSRWSLPPWTAITIGASLAEFEAIAAQYPVYRIDPPET